LWLAQGRDFRWPRLSDRAYQRQRAGFPGATPTEIGARSGKNVDALPPEIVMDVGGLVDAALLGFDRGKTVTFRPWPTPDWPWARISRCMNPPSGGGLSRSGQREGDVREKCSARLRLPR